MQHHLKTPPRISIYSTACRQVTPPQRQRKRIFTSACNQRITSTCNQHITPPSLTPTKRKYLRVVSSEAKRQHNSTKDQAKDVDIVRSLRMYLENTAKIETKPSGHPTSHPTDTPIDKLFALEKQLHGGEQTASVQTDKHQLKTNNSSSMARFESLVQANRALQTPKRKIRLFTDLKQFSSTNL